MGFNISVLNISSTEISGDFAKFLNPKGGSEVNDLLSGIFSDFADLFENLSGNQTGSEQNIWQGGCCSPPIYEDHCHPSGSLQTDGSVVTTPGGYKIESTGQYDWTITGPDGKSTKVWGDPHVEEGDGGKWDFKRDSTFVLGDGTRINVTTKPYGNGATVTSNLEIISGNDRVNISDIDQGKGKVGTVTEDGYSRTNSFGGSDVFVMGKESDDWSLQGREIKGSNSGGESFQLGDRLEAGNGSTPVKNDETDWMLFLKQLTGEVPVNWNNNWRPNNIGSNPYCSSSNHTSGTRRQTSYDRTGHQRQIMRGLHLMGRMFQLMGRMNSLNDRMNLSRHRALYA